MADEGYDNWCFTILKFLLFYWRSWFFMLWTIICMLIFVLGTEKRIRCLYGILLLTGWWVTECISIYMTGLLPLVVFPYLDIDNTGLLSLVYFAKSNTFLLAIMCYAIAMENSGLHKRIAYFFMIKITCSPRLMHFYLFLIATITSLFFLNTATTIFLCPIVNAILTEFNEVGMPMYRPKKPTDFDEDPMEPSDTSIAYYLVLAYGAIFGGTAYNMGAGVNYIFFQYYKQTLPDFKPLLDSSWTVYNLPIVIVMVIVAWFFIQTLYMGLCRPNSEIYGCVKAAADNAETTLENIKKKKVELGAMSFVEVGLSIVGIIVAVLLLTCDPANLPGWGQLYDIDVSDATPATLVIFLMAALPASFGCFASCNRDKSQRPTQATKALTPWRLLEINFDWGLILLLGAGYANGQVTHKSGLDVYILDHLKSLEQFQFLFSMLFAAFAGELLSNYGGTILIAPMMFALSFENNMHPICYAYPAEILMRNAILLPIGSPPLAVIRSYGNVHTFQLIKAGILLKILFVVIHIVLFPILGEIIFDLSENEGFTGFTFPEFVSETTAGITTTIASVVTTAAATEAPAELIL